MTDETNHPEAEAEKAHIQVGSVIVKRCSACGSQQPHHLDYVIKHGVCVV